MAYMQYIVYRNGLFNKLFLIPDSCDAVSRVVLRGAGIITIATIIVYKFCMVLRLINMMYAPAI